MRINRRTRAAAGVIAAIGLGAGLAACSSGPSTPANATQILQSDGYTVSAAYTTALQGGLASANAPAGEITSSVAGTNSAGDIQGVVVFDNAADAQSGASGAGSSPGITVATNGDVVTLTGPVSAWAALG
jgi:hypothetical protein